MRICAFLLVLGAAGAAPLSAQSLADVARQEAQRRQTLKDSGKSYSNQDLKPAPMPPPSVDAPQADSDQQAADDKSAATTPGAPGAAAAAATPEKDAKGDDDNAAVKADTKTEQRGQDYWTKRMADLRQRLDRDQTYFDAMQSRINALTTDFVNRDDPAQRSQIAAERQKALMEFDRLKTGIEADKKAIADAEEEARRADVPAGWLR